MDYVLLLALALLSLHLITKCWRRVWFRKQRHTLDQEFEPNNKVVSDGFYCLLLKDGSTRGGFINHKVDDTAGD